MKPELPFLIGSIIKDQNMNIFEMSVKQEKIS